MLFEALIFMSSNIYFSSPIIGTLDVQVDYNGFGSPMRLPCYLAHCMKSGQIDLVAITVAPDCLGNIRNTG